MVNSFTELQKQQNVSTQISLRSIISGMQNNVREQLWPDEAGWVQFVKDHYAEIKAKCVDTILDPSEADKYAHSLENYLDNKNIPRSVAWIVAWINQLDSDMHFDSKITNLLIPNLSQLTDMRQQYITTRVMYRKSLNTIAL